MNDAEAQRFVRRNLKVTHQRVGIAKRYILDQFTENQGNVSKRTPELLNAFARYMEASLPEEVVIHPDVDPTPNLRKIAEALTWQLAACEAIWGLVHADLLFPSEADLYSPKLTVTWQAPHFAIGLHFDDLCVPVPLRIVQAPSQRCRDDQPLCDGDLYLQELDIPNLHSGVEQALREAVRCFRHELYLACLAMLGRACEGARIELGLSLATVAVSAGCTKAEKLRKRLESPRPGIAQKIDDIMKFYSSQEALFKNVTETSQIRPYELDSAKEWTDLVRESRNSIHYGAEAAMSNSYEKVAVLLIGAVTHLKTVYRLMRAANEAAAN